MPKLLLTDFGSAKVLENFEDGLSHKTDRFRGTTISAAPEWEVFGKASRPYDMWSLGCVFLEILIWAFVPGVFRPANSVGLPSPSTDDNVHNDQYWRSDENGSFKLNEAVVLAFEKLDDHCQRLPAFKRIITLVRQLLQVDPRSRLTASNLDWQLRQLLVRTQQELDMNPNSYSGLTLENDGGGGVADSPLPNRNMSTPIRTQSPTGTVHGEDTDSLDSVRT